MFQTSKDLLTSSNLLVHFNPDLPLLLRGDYGVGAIRMPDGSERPIGYASRSLPVKLFQIEREALALVFGVQLFHAYISGHHFELVTNHQPPLACMSIDSLPVKRQPRSVAGHYFCQVMSTQLPSKKHKLIRILTHLVDFLWRKHHPNLLHHPKLVLLTKHLYNSPVTAHHIRICACRDPMLLKVL